MLQISAVNKERLGFNDFWLLVIGIPLLSFIMPPIFFDHHLFFDAGDTTINVAIAMFFVTLYWNIDRAIVLYYRKKYSGVGDIGKRLFYQVSTITIITMVLCVVSCYLMQKYIPSDIPIPIKSYGQVIRASLVVTYLVLSIYEVAYFVSRWKQSLIESEKLKKENIHSQLEMLKSQVNPHFLFNSLNTLSSLIPEDPELAVEFVQKLSKVYRYILEIKNKELITLKEELACIEAYNFLLQIRFGENLKVNMDIPETEKSKHIIPLALQLLIENAIKHNIVSTSKPLTIDIRMGKDSNLIVRNNLQVKKQTESSTKTGLDNIKSRYKILSNKPVDVIVTSDAFSVSIPLLEIQNHAGTNH